MQELPCFVCGFVTNIYCKDVKSLRSKHSETNILSYLEKFVGHDLSDDISRSNYQTVVCQNCMIKIDEYDELYMNAARLEDDLRTILLKTLEKQADIDEDDGWTSTDIPDLEETVATQRKQSKSPSMSCNICRRNFESFTDLRNHKHTARKLSKKDNSITKNPPVPGTFINYNTTTMIQQQQPQFEQISKGTPTLKCSLCNSTFINKVAIKEHYKRIHSDETRCDICGGLYADKERLKDHRDRHKNKNPLECVECQKVFKARNPLTRHMATHTLERFYVCEFCGKQFTHLSSFKMHMMAHDDVREKKCDECGHLFRSTSHLNRHKRVHTNEKPYQCLICHRSFAQRYNMMSHFKSHSKESQSQKAHSCAVCEKAFATVHQLKEHCETAHYTVDS
ncbi:zinc finger protein 62-like [Bradysia coprophila]|uniref:zinc finger protein 62-like n=1 Tax=Bradysia coprophila TaxID=38358 RepID=UPI00187D891C|nr:zinc finger protein 62-like [Bradysia coprophila]